MGVRRLGLERHAQPSREPLQAIQPPILLTAGLERKSVQKVEPLNIVILNDYGSVSGGAAAVAISSARGLAARGHRVIFFTAVGPIDPSLRASGIEVIDTGQQGIRADVNRFSSQVSMTWNSVAARSLLAVLAELDPRQTVLHLHGWTKALSSSVASVAVRRGFKLVCTLHDYAAACPRGSFFDRGTLGHCHRRPLSWDCMSADCGNQGYTLRIFRTVRQAAQQRLGKIPSGVHAFVVVTDFSRRLLAPYLPGHSIVREIPSPIDVERSGPVDVASNRAFLMIGRLTVEKGAVLLARAARECNVPLTFVGDGPSRAEISSVNPDATITGWLSKAEVYRHLRNARALVFPSLWYETQGLVVPEAAALGVPAVVGDSSAPVQSVRDGVTGLVFRGGDPDSLRTVLGRLSDDALVGQLGTASYEAFWESPPTLEQHVELLEQLYEAVLSRGAESLRGIETLVHLPNP
jgi:glycosyltransferase involved in cell wall biosynthesis